ncbi:MAG TPA: TonB family protein [Thermoanaerobaculia bacterium]|nr:TonB family protein [Thermoanaerobaculia bacterium]
MFETSTIKARAIAAPRRAGLLSMSIAFHSLIGVAAVAMSIQTGSFPLDAPRQMSAIIMPVAAPPLPRGNPDVPRNPQPKPQQQAAPRNVQTAPAPETTPSKIPDNTTPLASNDNSVPTDGNGTNTGEKWGVPDGDKHGIDVGQPITPQTLPATPTGPLVAVGDVHAARVLSRVEPKFPAMALKIHMSGVVRVHCIIDKQGNISDPRIVSSTFPAFNQPVLDALQQWTFAPGTLHGQPVDTYFELTITFNAR